MSMSDVNFRRWSGVISDDDSLTMIRPPRTAAADTIGNTSLPASRVGSARICMAGMSAATGTNHAGSLHLNIT
jgi:hypothetical protein